LFALQRALGKGRGVVTPLKRIGGVLVMPFLCQGARMCIGLYH